MLKRILGTSVGGGFGVLTIDQSVADCGASSRFESRLIFARVFGVDVAAATLNIANETPSAQNTKAISPLGLNQADCDLLFLRMFVPIVL